MYKIRLKGNCIQDTDVFYIDAKRETDDGKRDNTAEAEAIKEYCQTHIGEDIAILTPYTNQRKLLLDKLKDTVFEDSVMTVHASQGREWDTVLLSVVDTTNKWFTDSINKISRGKQVINTAVSRARKRLIIVCDKQYWERLNQQLIGQLLRSARSI